ncbi:MAG TPA: LacI family DNA-binding transcriptional regulator [Chthonomonadaceae bacterium]|nr:LacI family DNA-binding transcriptional regulator [Chthonomonadaceae bacterium]
MRITIKKIAQDLGISHSTVSRVLNDKHSNLVSEATRERIMEAAARMGYRPNRIAQALQGKSTQLIGVFVPDTDDQFFQTVIKHLRHTLEESGYELMVFVSAPNQITAKWHRLLQWDLDGVFVFDYMFYVDGLWEALTEHSGPIPPVVGLFSNKTQLKDYVTIDFQPALEALLAHLREQGCRRFGYMAFPTSFHPSEQRYAVFSDFVARNFFQQYDVPVLYGQPSLMEAARQGMSAWLAEGQPLPDALFCQNDELALGAYRALCEARISVPEQIALAGCDDLPYISYLETPLTSLSLPVAEVCRQGWSILQKRITEPEGSPLQVVLEVSLKLRASCEKRAGRSV